MKHKQCSIVELCTLITADCVLLTPNERLTAYLKQQWHEWQVSHGHSTWDSPHFYAQQSYFKHLYNACNEASFVKQKFLLSRFESLLLWEKIIIESTYHELLLQPQATAVQALQAYTLLKEWQLDTSDSLFESIDEYQAMASWQTAYESYITQHQLIDSTYLPGLIHYSASLKNCLAKKYILVNFATLTPQLNHFLSHAKDQGCEILLVTLSHARAEISYSGFADGEQEIISMANWAQQHLSQNPHRRIACIIPSLNQQRERVLQIFNEVFCQTQDKSPLPNEIFNLSAGKPLNEYGIIKTALDIIALSCKKTLNIDEVQQLLLSPFVYSQENEQLLQASFLHFLKQNNRLHCEISNFANELLAAGINQLAEKWQQLQNYCTQLPAQQSYNAWLKCFLDLLNIFAWPGSQSLDSEHYQISQHFLQLFKQLQRLDHLLPNTTANEVFTALSSLAQHTVFQAESPPAPIQILGILEAVGQPFDAIWVAEMDDTVWPPQPKPNPFIPKRLQREYGLPHSSAAKELEYCQTIMQQLSLQTAQLIYSYAEQKDGMEREASTLIRNFNLIEPAALVPAIAPSPSALIFNSLAIDYFSDDLAPAVANNEKIRGGTTVLKNQALCAFKAFAESRLNARAPEVPVLGLRPQDRGNLLHKSLELVWQVLQDQQQLLQYDSLRLNRLVEHSVDAAMQAVNHNRHNFSFYLALEKQRLTQLILQWLELEKTRPAFTVLLQEKSLPLKIGELALALRIDRVDQLADEQLLIIDYKTSKYCEPNKWFGSRLEEPQLPLYALNFADNTLAISFAQLAKGHLTFKGVAATELDIDGIKPLEKFKHKEHTTWQQQLTLWQQDLTQLANDFLHGTAVVNPKDSLTCNFCSLQALCRIFDKGALLT